MRRRHQQRSVFFVLWSRRGLTTRGRRDDCNLRGRFRAVTRGEGAVGQAAGRRRDDGAHRGAPGGPPPTGAACARAGGRGGKGRAALVRLSGRRVRRAAAASPGSPGSLARPAARAAGAEGGSLHLHGGRDARQKTQGEVSTASCSAESGDRR